MGQSTDAIHFYGVLIDNDSPAHDAIERWYNSDEVDGDPEKWLKARGIDNVTVGHHCSDRYVMYYVAVADTEVRAYRGSPMRVGIPDVSPQGKVALHNALLTLGIADDKPIDWWIASWWSG